MEIVKNEDKAIIRSQINRIIIKFDTYIDSFYNSKFYIKSYIQNSAVKYQKK